MLKRIKGYRTLSEFRDRELGLNQVQVAKDARVHWTRISQLERGALPKGHRFWSKYLLAYRLEKWPQEFERMARAGGAA